jgi:hypothetical protein
VKNVVNELPTLQHLKLGDFCPTWDKNDNYWLPGVWGKALQYVQIVEEHYHND